MTVLQTIRILVIIQLLRDTSCQDGFGNQELLRYHQMASNNDQGQMSSLGNYGAVMQRDQANHVLTSALQFNDPDESSKNEYKRSPLARSKKIYHIKNPFQNKENEEVPQENNDAQDSTAGASNQYASMQYSLPPEEFLQQLRAENQYYQQQLSTPAPNLGFTATPQPQYQYSTISVASPSYDINNQQNTQTQQDSKPGQTYLPSPSPYLYSTPSTFLDNIQSTPSPITSYLSTPINNGQFVGTQSSSYVSSSSPLYLSSPSNWHQYVSSPFTSIHTASPTYNNNDLSKKNQLAQYDYSSSGIRLPTNFQQYQNDYTTTTTASPYFDSRESWQNGMSSGLNTLSKSLQAQYPFAQYTNSYNNNPQAPRVQNNLENNEDDTQRMGNLASANNMYINYAQPDKVHSPDVDHETGQKDLYSNGDYGWKLTDRKPVTNNDAYTSSYSRYQTPKYSSDSVAVSQMNFHLDTSRPQNHEKVSKSNSDTEEAQEFAKAAAKAHDRLKQQQFYNSHYVINNVENEPFSNLGNSYNNNNDVQKGRYIENFHSNNYPYSNDLITASPHYFTNLKDNGDTKSKQPFDHDKALKNIVSIGVSNVVTNSDSPSKTSSNVENSNHSNLQNYKKEPSDQQQYLRPVTDSYYKDKNGQYSFGGKSRPDEYVTPDSLKQLETYIYGRNQQSQDQPYSVTNYASLPQNLGGTSQLPAYQDSSMQASAFQQSGVHRNQNLMSPSITSILKLNDVPYRLTQGLSSEALRLHNVNFDQGAHILPTPLPNRINQNVDTHQLDVATSLLNRYFLNKQLTANLKRPEIYNPTDVLSTINGYKVANPFNVDLKLVADMLKEKPTLDNSQMISLKDQYSKQTPLKLDLSQLQTLLNNENNANLPLTNEPHTGISNPFMEIYNNGRYPYQGVKYSRSEEEEESLVPIVESSNSHPIGAVIDQGDPTSEREVSGFSDITAQEDDFISSNFEENKSKSKYLLSKHKTLGDRPKNSNLLLSGRHPHPRKYPKSEVEEPYRLLKPPPARTAIARSTRVEKNTRRRRVSKPKYLRVLKSEPLYEAGTESESSETSKLLRPPHPIAEAKSDTFEDKQSA